MLLYNTITTWYAQHKRPLPWRSSKDPYAIWVAEIMLQQTRIEAVLPYYDTFLKTYPTLLSLANANEQALLKIWQGLGYYARVRNLQKAAKLVVEQYDGQLPLDYDLLLKLPGIGTYTAAAIVSIAADAPYVCVDGNIMRVYSRIFAYEQNVMLAKSRKEIEAALLKQVGPKSGDFNEGLMELGETICLPQNPQCEKCPCVSFCLAYKRGRQNELPQRIKITKIKAIEKTVLVLRYQASIALRKRSESLLHNLYEPYTLDRILTMEEIQDFSKTPKKDIQFLGIYKHIFSHQTWKMHVYVVDLNFPLSLPEFHYYDVHIIKKHYPLPTAYYKWLEPILK